jgi:hypothetical protein
MSGLRRLGLAVLAFALCLGQPARGHAGGEPEEKPPREWLPIAAAPSGDIVEFIRRLASSSLRSSHASSSGLSSGA